MDGDPHTMWHTRWDENAPNFPHELVIELPKPARIAGLTCLPRQDNNRNGWIKEYAVYASADGKNWGSPLTQGVFARDAALHTVTFPATVETRFLKLVALSSFDRWPSFR